MEMIGRLLGEVLEFELGLEVVDVVGGETVESEREMRRVEREGGEGLVLGCSAQRLCLIEDGSTWDRQLGSCKKQHLGRERRKVRGGESGSESESWWKRWKCGGLPWPRWGSCCGCGSDQSRNQDAKVVWEAYGQCRSGHHAGEQVGSGVGALGDIVRMDVLLAD